MTAASRPTDLDAPAGVPAPDDVADLADRAAAALPSLLSAYAVPGTVVAVGRGDDVAVRSAGIANVRTQLAMLPDTRVCVGSVTKVLTAALTMDAVRTSRLGLHTPVSHYLPELAVLGDQTAPTTVEHLLTHRAGFYGDVMNDDGRGEDALTRYVTELPERTFHQCAPGMVTAYNNAAFCVLGRLVERLHDQPFEDVMTRHVLDVAGMESSALFPEQVMPFSFAVGHRAHESAASSEPADMVGCHRSLNPAGGLIATAQDMVRFGLRTLAASDDDPTVFGAVPGMLDPRVPGNSVAASVGLAWLRRELNGHQLAFHGGRVADQVSMLALEPGSGTVVFVASNADTGHLLQEDVLSLLFPSTGAGADERMQPLPTVHQVEATDLAGWYAAPDAQLLLESASAFDGPLLRLSVRAVASDSDQSMSFDVGPWRRDAADLTPYRGATWAAAEGYFRGRRAVFLDAAGQPCTPGQTVTWLSWLGRLYRRTTA